MKTIVVHLTEQERNTIVQAFKGHFNDFDEDDNYLYDLVKQREALVEYLEDLPAK